MERQLQLLEVPDLDWKLDDETKERGRRNVDRARAALAAARQRALHERRATPEQPHAA